MFKQIKKYFIGIKKDFIKKKSRNITINPALISKY